MEFLTERERVGSVEDQDAVDPKGQSGALRAERRRPGVRTQHVNLELLPLLREPDLSAEQAATPEVPEGDDPDRLRFFRGLGIGLAMSVPLWAVIILVVSRLFF